MNDNKAILEIYKNSLLEIKDITLYVTIAQSIFNEYVNNPKDYMGNTYPDMINQSLKEALVHLVKLHNRVGDPWYKRLFRRIRELICRL